MLPWGHGTFVRSTRRARHLVWIADKRRIGSVGVGLLMAVHPHRRRPGTDLPYRRRHPVTRTHPLAFPIRLPDALQDEALRLLDASRAAINQLLVGLWPDLDRFAAERTGPAWKQVERYVTRRSGHGRRPRALRDGAGGQDPASPGHAEAGLPDHPAPAY